VTCTVAGDPDYRTSIRIIREMADAGADMVELVMPFSDPVADGPVIQEAGARALASGMNTDRFFSLVREVRELTGIPLVVLTYANLVVQRGIRSFYREAALAGADAVAIADVPLEEAEPFCTAAREAGIDPVLFVSQTTSVPRMKRILDLAGGFVYVVAAMGVTGVRETLDPAALDCIRKLRRMTDLPVVPGFGISTPAQVMACADAGADGVIVGSALVREIGAHLEDRTGMAAAVRQKVQRLKPEAGLVSPTRL